MKGYLDAKELESYKKEDLQELAKQLGVDAEGTKKEIATRCAAVEVDIPDESELTEEDKRAAEEAAAEAAAKAEEEEAATELVKVKAQRRFLDKELNQIKDTGDEYAVSRAGRGRRSSSNRRVRKRVQAMAADTTTLTEKMRAALRISSTSEKITEEINDCIAACKADMKNDGVKVIRETDGLIIRAITLYCKAEFGFNNAAEQFRKSYDALKMRLSLSAEYNTAPQVSETDTNSTESGV